MNDSLFENRVIMLTGTIDNAVSDFVIEQMLKMEYSNPYKDIRLIINSHGGSVPSGFAIIDIINYIKCDVRTYALGLAGSMAAFILSCGTKGKRFAFENSNIMFHQPSLASPEQKQISDVLITARQAQRTKNHMIYLLSKNTGKSENIVEQILERDSFMTPQQAVNFGAVDNIIINKRTR